MGEKIEPGEAYKGPCGVLKDSNWLSAETIPADRDTVVQIEKVVRRKSVKFKNETKNGYGSLKFTGIEKELGLNSTNLRILSALFGSDTSKWFGQWIALYVDPAVSSFGQIVSAVRIRAKKPDPSNDDRKLLLQRIKEASATLHLSDDQKKLKWTEHCGTTTPQNASVGQLTDLCEALEAEAMA